MKKTKNLRKKGFALLLTTILFISASINVFAASNNSSTVGNTVAEDSGGISTCAIGSCIASDGMITTGYGGDLVLHLDKSYFDIYVRAAATGNSNNAVSCSVTFPDGSTYPLGYVIADGSKTAYLCYSGTAPAGDYTFHFTGTDEGTTGFLGFIYSSSY